MRRIFLFCCLAAALLAATVQSQQPDGELPPKGKGFGGGGKGGKGFSRPGPEPAAAPAPAPRRWEYGVFTQADIVNKGEDDFEAGLNKLGDDGWELVSIDFGINSTPGSARGSSRSRRPTFYFKRPKDGLARTRAFSASADVGRPQREQLREMAAREIPNIFSLKYAQATRLAQVIQTTYSRSNLVRVVPDERTNSLVVMAPPEQLTQVRNLISQLDQQPPTDAKQKK